MRLNPPRLVLCDFRPLVLGGVKMAKIVTAPDRGARLVRPFERSF